MSSRIKTHGASLPFGDFLPCVVTALAVALLYFLFRAQILAALPEITGLPLARTPLDWTHQIWAVAATGTVAAILGACLAKGSPWTGPAALVALTVGAIAGIFYLQTEYGIVIDFLPAIILSAAILTYALLRENVRKDRTVFIQEMALNHKDTLLKLVFENTYDGIFVANENGEIIYANRSGLGLFGYEKEQIIGQSLDMLNPALQEGSAAREISHYLRLAKLESRQVGPFPTVGLRRDGKVFKVDLTVGTVWLKRADHRLERRTGDRLLFVCNMWDSTVRGRLEEMQRPGFEEEIMADRAMAEFVANMSHELRTPLNAIMGFSELLASPAFGPLTEKQQEYARDINDSAGHLLKVINDILDISKIESGKTDLKEQEVEPAELVASCIRLVSGKAEECDIAVRALPMPPNLRLYVDERQIKQVLINLLSNAVKFTLPGGDVEVGGETAPDGSFSFSVSDSGIGIPAKDIPVVLAPFGQVDRGLDRKYEGTGLGLPLSKRLMEAHGGALAIRSFIGIGTTVTVTLPAERVREKRAQAAG